MGLFALFQKFPSSLISRVQTSRIGLLWQIYSEKLDEFEGVRAGMAILRDLNAAEGEILDRMGSIVGETRDGRDDEEFRLFIKIAISKNISSGSIPEIIQIAKVISGTQSFKLTELHDLPVDYFFDGNKMLDGTRVMSPGRRREGAFEVEFSGDIHTLQIPKNLSKAVGQIRAAGIQGAVRALMFAPNMITPLINRSGRLTRTQIRTAQPISSRSTKILYFGKPAIDAPGVGLMDGLGLWNGAGNFGGTDGITPSGRLIYSERTV